MGKTVLPRLPEYAARRSGLLRCGTGGLIEGMEMDMPIVYDWEYISAESRTGIRAKPMSRLPAVTSASAAPA